MKKKEESLQLSICNYIRLQYPGILFNSDSSGVRLTIGQSVKIKKMKSCPGWPDLFLSEPRGRYHGLFIELKKEGEKLFKKDGITPISDHVKEQMKMIEKLKNRNYYACFCIGFDDAVRTINHYLKFIINQ